MSKRLVLALSLALGLTLAGCGLMDPPRPHFETSLAKAGPFEGQVTALHTNPNLVSTVDKTGKEAMDTDFQKLHVGDRIQGRILVEPHDDYLTDIRIVR